MTASVLRAAPKADHSGYRQAFLDWLACAWAGREQPAARSARALADDGLDARLVATATAGHVLDFDDTYVLGLVHLSAATAPAALVLGAERGATIGEVLEAYAVGFEVMAAVSRASYPSLYDRGWHATAVCGVFGSAAVASTLLGLDEDTTEHAFRTAILGAGGMRAAFGSDGKSLQVGMAVAQGVRGARLAAAGARVSSDVLEGVDGFAGTYGGTWSLDGVQPAIEENWVKAYPCCLQTHGPIEAAIDARERGATPAGSGTVRVHPVSLQAAALGDVATGLEAKFSIPYLTAFGLTHGSPAVVDFHEVDPRVRDVARRVRVEADVDLGESEAVLTWHEGGAEIRTQVSAAMGSPQRPMSDERLREKVTSLAGGRLDGCLDDPQRPASELLDTLEST